MDIPGLKPYVPEVKFYPELVTGTPLEQIMKVLNDPTKDSLRDLRDVIQNNYHDILTNSFLTNYDNREQILTILSSENFLSALIDVLKRNYMRPDEIICCNKVTYDYKCQKVQSQEIKNLLLELSHTVNRELVEKLSTVIDTNLAENLALVSRSSFSPGNNVKRANNFIIRYCEDITPQELEYIFGYLYKDQSFKAVFNAVMFDVWNGHLFQNNEEVRRYFMIYEVTMQILNLGMTISDIYTILMNYKAACDIMDESMHTRFNTNDLEHYPRVQYVYLYMQNQGIYLR